MENSSIYLTIGHIQQQQAIFNISETYITCLERQKHDTFPDPHPQTMLSPCDKNDLWISTLSRGRGGVSKMGFKRKTWLYWSVTKLAVNRRTL